MSSGPAGGTSTIFFRELKDARSLGSQEFAVIVILEAAEIDLDAYRTLKQRCRQGALPSFIILEGNPPMRGHWLERLQNPREPDYDADLTVMKLTSRENWPYMTEAYRHSLESMPRLWYQRMVEAETGALPSGTPVYPTFIEALHVRPTSLIPDRGIVRFFDFGLRRPACLWGQLDEARRLYVQHEWLPFEIPEEQFLDGVLVRSREWYGPKVAQDIGDPAAENRDLHGTSTLERMSRRGMALQFKRTTYRDRVPLVNKKLSELVDGRPLITIDPRCQTLIQALAGGYHYRELTEGREMTRRLQEPVKDGTWDHVANAFEYGVIVLYGASSGAVQRTIALKRQRQRRIIAQRRTAVFF